MTDDTQKPDQRGSIKSAERVMDLLELISRQRDGLGFTALIDALDYPKSSLHGLLRALTDRGFLSYDPEGKVYRIGVGVWEAGQSYTQAAHTARVALPHLRNARDVLGETVQMAILDGLDNVYIAKEESPQAFRLVSDVGNRLPAHTTGLGKVLLAALPSDELDRRLEGVRLSRYTQHTVTGHDELKARLERIRVLGYAEDSGEYTLGLYCLAVPVKRRGSVVAAISCSTPVARLNRPVTPDPRMLNIMTSTAAAISRDL